MSSNLARQLHWLIAIRLVVVTSVVLPYFLVQLVPEEPVVVEGAAGPIATPSGSPSVTIQIAPSPAVDTRLLYLIAGLTYFASLVYIVLLRVLSGHHRAQAYVQFVGDLALVTLLVYFFGGIGSPFSILYLVVIAVSTTLLRSRSTGVATLAFLFYAALLLLLYVGWVPMPDGSVLTQDATALRRLLYNVAVHLFGFYSVVMLTWFLVANVARAERDLEAKEEDLADLETRYRDVVQSITSGLVTTDSEGIVTGLNQAGQQILRREPSEVVGRHVSETGIVTAEEGNDLARRQGGHGRLTRDLEVGPDKNPITVGYSLAELRSAEGDRTGTLVIFQDLTPWRRLEEEVRMKDRMAAVGTLAAGLAHEIGNPLAAISGSVQMLSRSIADGSPEHRLLGILHKESQRLDRTIKGFLEYARPKRRTPIDFDVARLLAENFELLENSPEVGEHHRLELRLDPPSARLLADADGVSQIFWNLARNALKAMPDGGRLTISGTLAGERYLLEFADTGRGMTSQERANLFHPFHSFFDEGTGLGMAIVYRIVQDHGGELAVDSREGELTRITIALPRSARSAFGTSEAALGEIRDHLPEGIG